MHEQNSSIRNFCIIAHIDHGKSTLADRLIELTGTVERRVMKEQLLDTMDIERERGITIKLQPIRMQWKGTEMNLIDTPGHIDFNYEVSRSLAAVEGALLLVDASQGIEAQTLANLYLALEQNLTIIPVINKIDLPAADVAKTKQEIVKLLGCDPNDIIAVSAKTGENVTQLLDAIVARIPAPKNVSPDVTALIFDAEYNEYKGVIIYTRLFGGSLQVGDHIELLRTATDTEILEVGYFAPRLTPCPLLRAGEIGYVVTSIKDVEQTRVGDTIAIPGSRVAPLQGYREVHPMVFAGVYPADGTAYEKLRKAVYKLKLNDASLVFTPDHSEVLGFGFRCGFLGLLHLEIFQERLVREFDLPVTITAPTVAYKVIRTNGQEELITSPNLLPEENRLERVEQPMVIIDMITPKKMMGNVMDYLQQQKGVLLHTEFINEERLILKYRLPLSNILIDFYDHIKNLSSGYASYTYEVIGYEECSVAKLEIHIADSIVPALTTLVDTADVQRIARRIVSKLKDIIPRAQFVIKIQAAVGAKIVASERISALRKDVTAKLYGGDVTRKRKLLEKQKKGKKKMALHGGVEIPDTAYLAVLRRD